MTQANTYLIQSAFTYVKNFIFIYVDFKIYQ